MSNDAKTLWVGNLPDNIKDELLYELFLQAGPLEKVHIPKGKSYAFIQFKHPESVPYSARIMDGITLFGKMLNLRSRTGGSATDSPTQPRFNTPDSRRVENVSSRGSSPYDSSSPRNYDQHQQNKNNSSGNYGNNSMNYYQQRQMHHSSLPNMQPSSGRRHQRRYNDSGQSSRSSQSEYKGYPSQASYRHEPYRRY